MLFPRCLHHELEFADPIFTMAHIYLDTWNKICISLRNTQFHGKIFLPHFGNLSSFSLDWHVWYGFIQINYHGFRQKNWSTCIHGCCRFWTLKVSHGKDFHHMTAGENHSVSCDPWFLHHNPWNTGTSFPRIPNCHVEDLKKIKKITFLKIESKIY